MKLIVVIPAYNEECSIGKVIKEIPRSFRSIKRVKILVVDDGSTDKTAKLAKSAGADYIISNSQNQGLAFSFRKGLEKALKLGADIIVNIDADLQYNPKEIPRVVKPILEKKAEMVIGDRGIKKLSHMPRIKKIGNLLMTWVLRRFLGANIKDASSGFRAFSRECALKLNIYSNYTYTHETIIQCTFQKMRIENVPVEFKKRKYGNSRLIKTLWGHFKQCTSTAVRISLMYSPFRTFLKIGTIGIFLGLIFWIRYLFFYFKSDKGAHIQSLLFGVILIIAGIQVIIMGFLADIIDTNRKRQEEVLYRIKRKEYEEKKQRKK